MKISKDLINNDVPAKGQLKDGECVSFHLTDDADIKIAFLGNSITRHGKAENLGWFGDWGMAASRKENDYVHKLVSRYKNSGKRVSYCIVNLSEFERTQNTSILEERFNSVRVFKPDIIVVRLGENAQLTDCLDAFKLCYREMVEFFASDDGTVVLTDLFWQYEPFDKFVEEYAKEKGFFFVKLHDLGNSNAMKAIDKFEHKGVAAHPGDSGMAEIADRIYKALNGN